jgi:hypothetical protein
LPRSVPAQALEGEVVENRWARWIWLHGLRSEGGRVSVRI